MHLFIEINSEIFSGKEHRPPTYSEMTQKRKKMGREMCMKQTKQLIREYWEILVSRTFIKFQIIL